MPVEIDIASVIHSFKINISLFAIGGRGIIVEMFPIPSYASGQLAGAAGKVRGICALYAPVMRQVQCAPFGVGKSGLCGIRRVAERELPSVVEKGRGAETYLGVGCSGKGKESSAKRNPLFPDIVIIEIHNPVNVLSEVIYYC